MKKVLKLSAIAMVILALVLNFHTAMFTFYGIKTNNLAGQVWAQSTSTSTSTNGNGTGGDGTGGDASSGVFGNPQWVNCYTEHRTSFVVKRYASGNASGSFKVSPNTTSLAEVSVGAGGSFTEQSEMILILTQGQEKKCPGYAGFCSTIDCAAAPGTKPTFVVTTEGLHLQESH